MPKAVVLEETQNGKPGSEDANEYREVYQA